MRTDASERIVSHAHSWPNTHTADNRIEQLHTSDETSQSFIDYLSIC